MDFEEFLDGILLFRGVRGWDDKPEAWMERWLKNIENGGHDSKTAERLSLMTKMAELIDDRKPELLEEIEKDFRAYRGLSEEEFQVGMIAP